MYKIVIKIEGIEKRRRSVSLLHLLAGFFLLAKASDYYRLSHFQQLLPLILFYSLALASILYGFFRKRWDAPARYNTLIRGLQAAAFAGLGILLWRIGSRVDIISSFIWVALCLIILFSEKKVFKDMDLLIDKTGITIPGFYADRLLNWTILSDITIRPDYITIFHKDQKYLQYQVLQELSLPEVAQIMDFCKEQLSPIKEPVTNPST